MAEDPEPSSASFQRQARMSFTAQHSSSFGTTSWTLATSLRLSSPRSDATSMVFAVGGPVSFPRYTTARIRLSGSFNMPVFVSAWRFRCFFAVPTEDERKGMCYGHAGRRRSLSVARPGPAGGYDILNKYPLPNNPTARSGRGHFNPRKSERLTATNILVDSISASRIRTRCFSGIAWPPTFSQTAIPV